METEIGRKRWCLIYRCTDCDANMTVLNIFVLLLMFVYHQITNVLDELSNQFHMIANSLIKLKPKRKNRNQVKPYEMKKAPDDIHVC